MTPRRSERMQDFSRNYGDHHDHGEETDSDRGDGRPLSGSSDDGYPLSESSATTVTSTSTPDMVSDCETIALSKVNLSETAGHRWARKFYLSHVILGLMLALMARLILFGQHSTPPVIEVIQLDAMAINFSRRVHNILPRLTLVADKTSSLPAGLDTPDSPFGTTRLGVVELVRRLSHSTASDIKDAKRRSEIPRMNLVSYEKVLDAERLVDIYAEAAKKAWGYIAWLPKEWLTGAISSELPWGEVYRTFWRGGTLDALSTLEQTMENIAVAQNDPFFHRVNMTPSHYSHRLPAKLTPIAEWVLQFYSKRYNADRWMSGSCAFLSKCSRLEDDDFLHPACYALWTETTFDLQQHFERIARRTPAKPGLPYFTTEPGVFRVARSVVGLSVAAMQMVTLSKQAGVYVAEEDGWLQMIMPHMPTTSPENRTAAQILPDVVLGVLSEQIRVIMEVLFDIRDACGELDKMQALIHELSNPDSWVRFDSGTKTIKQMKHPLDQFSLLQNEGRLMRSQMKDMFHHFYAWAEWDEQWRKRVHEFVFTRNSSGDRHV
ncbi:hypothetical protein FPOA_09211 [Fusarium poae]|uniref:Transmembrane protein n=1 Tax=Fusarium poae TaxID=36050 RepID=A0A1B8AQU3_FUSPO|nr:hypothetical protein FPOA_09211 [Fusarium poae]